MELPKEIDMQRIPKPPQDPLKHFSKDPAHIRLIALFFVRAHLILWGVAAAITAVARAYSA